MKLQVSAAGIGPEQMKPDAPPHEVTPAQLPTPGTSLVQDSPPPTPSSMTKSQSLSRPSQSSSSGVSASQADQPMAGSQLSSPKQVPIELVREQVRISPAE